MKQEDIDLLKKDLSSRIPYGLKIQIGFNWYDEQQSTIATMCGVNGNFVVYNSFTGEEETSITKVKPYLRPLSDMTKEEKEELLKYTDNTIYTIDFYNSHHLDYRGLIPKGLAIETTKDTYKN